MFVATINTPGYLPEAEPAYFDTARDAWLYLATERRSHEDDVVFENGDFNGYSETANKLESLTSGTMDDYANQGLDYDGSGTVYGPTPGYDGNHDLGLAYSVNEAV